jgi:CDP-glucose 4,6-dehydratase
LTGHTGFKGAWMAYWLTELGADVTGFALPPEDPRALYTIAGIASRIRSEIGDLCDRRVVTAFIAQSRPQIVIHMAAQALVRRAVADPVRTFATNVMGTVHLLDALRESETVTDILVVSSDKVYDNREYGSAFAETAPLGGNDPYSGSKVACEHATQSYWATYFDPRGVSVATARAGNVIGGGDRSVDRIIPDCIRALEAGVPVVLRNPEFVRPWQHVLDCLCGYLVYVERLATVHDIPRSLNFGPRADERLTVDEVVSLFFKAYGRSPGVAYANQPASIEKKMLTLDASRAEIDLGWRCALSQRESVAWTADWHREAADTCTQPEGVRALMARQIAAYDERLAIYGNKGELSRAASEMR